MDVFKDPKPRRDDHAAAAEARRGNGDVYLDKVFLNVVGLDIERGATSLDAEEAVVFRATRRQAREVIAVADHTKLGHISPALIRGVAGIHTLVTDSGATDAMVAPFLERGVGVLQV